MPTWRRDSTLNSYDYNFINQYNARISPSTVHCKNTGLVNYYVRYLVQKVISVFEFLNIPDTWAINYFQYVLVCRGYIGILDTDRYGVIPQECGLGGFNIFYQPQFITVANPLLPGIRQPVIGEECEVIKMQPDYGGVMDLVSKTQAESFKKMFDKIASGEPAVVVDKNLFNEDGSRNWDVFFQNLKQNYVASDILNDMKTLEDQFNTAIGIPNANTQKRERLITDEVNANNIDTEAKIGLWLDTMRRDMRRVNEMFGLDLDVRYRFADQMEVTEE